MRYFFKGADIPDIMQEARIYEFDALRGIVAMLIVLFHFTFGFDFAYPQYLHASKLLFIVEFGRNYVYLFLMMSGFFIMRSLEHKKDSFEFAISRFSRLYPAYWVATILTFVVALILGLPGRQVPFFEAIINLTMLQGFLHLPDVIGGGWVLDRLLMFYFIFFIISFLKKLKNIKKIMLLWAFFTLFLQIYKMHPLIDTPLIQVILRYLFVFTIANYIHHFIIGILLYFYSKQKKFEKGDMVLLAVCFLLSYVTDGITQLIFAVGFTLVAILISTHKMTFLNNRFLIFLGAISYPLYLVHQNIGYALFIKSNELGINPNLSVFFMLLLCIFLAYIITKYVEQPSYRAINAFYFKIKRLMAEKGKN